MDHKKNDTASRLDVIINKSNLASARFQRIQQPWFSSSNESATDDQHDEDDIGQFQGESELTGLSSKSTTADEDALAMLQRTRTSTKDRLLEQLLGKQGAQAHLKRQQTSKQAPSKAAVSKDVQKPAISASKDQASDSESDGGRAATILRKKLSKPAKASKQPTTDDQDDTTRIINGSEQQRNDLIATVKPSAGGKGKTSSGKRKAHSYLDELLAERSNKKNKKKG